MSDPRVSLLSIATLTYDTLRFAEFEDFPETSEPVWILGRKYSIFTGNGRVGAQDVLLRASPGRDVGPACLRLRVCVFSRKGRDLVRCGVQTLVHVPEELPGHR